MKQKIYLIDWIDAAGSEGWKSSSDLDLPIMKVQTIGFYISENEESITVALNRAVNDGYYPYGELISIPKVCIKRKKIIKVDYESNSKQTR